MHTLIFQMSSVGFNGTKYIATPGNIVHGGANMYLEKKVLSDRDWEFITILYNAHSPGSEKQFDQLHFELDIGTNPRLTELLWQTWRAYNEPGELAIFEMNTLFNRILLNIFYSCQNRGEDDTYALYKRICDYIHVHFMDELSVSQIAELHELNENQLFYIFNKYINMGAGDYLRNYRLNRAKELLLMQGLSVKETAYSVGYSDPHYFSRIFKKKNGISPTAFLKKFKNNPSFNKE